MTTRTHGFDFALPTLALRGVAPLRLMSLIGLSRQRRALAELDERTLRDIGVTREEALKEASRPAWDVPTHWQG